LDRDYPPHFNRSLGGVEKHVPAPVYEAQNPSGKILPAVLFLVTCFTTLVAGFFLDLQFTTDSGEEAVRRVVGLVSNPADLLAGAPFAISILTILLAHEMGHYLACRYYGINATLPYVLPAPPPLMPFGTFGAVIRIKSMFGDRRQLFDVGIAGPLAGFVFILPALAVGLKLSTEYESIDALESFLEFGEPLLFQWAVGLFFEGEGVYLRLHPIGWAAWFGMLATSLNLLPIGQLDGGHIAYSLFGARGHRTVSYMTFIGLVLLSLFSWPMLGYLIFALVLLIMRFRHPPPLFDGPALGRGRTLLAIGGLVVFILTFIPVPVQFVERVGSL
jgi:membrane-associated protease RseP (regulator of RpoE activity)